MGIFLFVSEHGTYFIVIKVNEVGAELYTEVKVIKSPVFLTDHTVKPKTMSLMRKLYIVNIVQIVRKCQMGFDKVYFIY